MTAVLLAHNGRAQYDDEALRKPARNRDVGQDDVVFVSDVFIVALNELEVAVED